MNEQRTRWAAAVALTTMIGGQLPAGRGMVAGPQPEEQPDHRTHHQPTATPTLNMPAVSDLFEMFDFDRNDGNRRP